MTFREYISVMKLDVLKDMAREVGFDAVGVAPAALLSDEVEKVKKWVVEGKNAGMSYMERNMDVREDVSRLVEGAKSVIVTLTNYYNPWQQPVGVPKIAMYARGKDYHRVVKDRLFTLWEKIQLQMPDEKGRCFVDSAPVLEHAWAKRAGLGWQGKNTLLIRKGLGSFCFIGVIITTAEFETYDTPFVESFCGKCSRCVEACPTGALTIGNVDATRCISYQTIENKEVCPAELKKMTGDWIFGCDICQMVCPWNARLTAHRCIEFMPAGRNMELSVDDWEKMTEQNFDILFNETPLKRTGLWHIKSNLKKKSIKGI